jgi:hypothetical protein
MNFYSQFSGFFSSFNKLNYELSADFTNYLQSFSRCLPLHFVSSREMMKERPGDGFVVAGRGMPLSFGRIVFVAKHFFNK